MNTAPRIVGYLNADSVRGMLEDGVSCAEVVATVEALGPSKYYALIDLFENEDLLRPDWREELQAFFYRHQLPYGATRALIEAAVRIILAVRGLGQVVDRPWHAPRLHPLALRREPQLCVAHIDPTAQGFYVEVSAPWSQRRVPPGADTLTGIPPGWYGPQSLHGAELLASTRAAIEATIRAVAPMLRWEPRQHEAGGEICDALPRRAYLEFPVREQAGQLGLPTGEAERPWRYTMLLHVGDDPDWRHRDLDHRRLIDPNEASELYLRRRSIGLDEQVAGPIALIRARR